MGAETESQRMKSSFLCCDGKSDGCEGLVNCGYPRDVKCVISSVRSVSSMLGSQGEEKSILATGTLAFSANWLTRRKAQFSTLFLLIFFHRIKKSYSSFYVLVCLWA